MTPLLPIPGNRYPWDPYPGEEPAAHALFLLWLHSEPRGESPLNLAAKFQWRERSIAYDNLCQLPATASERVHAALDFLSTLTFVGIRKHLQNEIQTRQPTMPLRDYLQAGAFLATGGKMIAESTAAARQAGTSENAALLQKATVAELETMLELTERLEKR